MSYSYVLPGAQSSSGSAKRWLLTYPLAQLVCLGAAALAALLARNLQWPDGSYEALALSAATAVLYALTFGYLRGCVLRERLARFSMLWWCAATAAVSFFTRSLAGPVVGLCLRTCDRHR
jgi:fucose permease